MLVASDQRGRSLSVHYTGRPRRVKSGRHLSEQIGPRIEEFLSKEALSKGHCCATKIDTTTSRWRIISRFVNPVRKSNPSCSPIEDVVETAEIKKLANFRPSDADRWSPA